jgi:hypothetical protein
VSILKQPIAGAGDSEMLLYLMKSIPAFAGTNLTVLSKLMKSIKHQVIKDNPKLVVLKN